MTNGPYPATLVYDVFIKDIKEKKPQYLIQVNLNNQKNAFSERDE